MVKKKCKRCGKEFICNHNDIKACQCSAISLNKKEKEYISKLYTDCLCIDCLKILKEEANK